MCRHVYVCLLLIGWQVVTLRLLLADKKEPSKALLNFETLGAYPTRDWRERERGEGEGEKEQAGWWGEELAFFFFFSRK